MKRSEKRGTKAPAAASRLRHEGTQGDSTLVRALCRWFAAHQRDLPWRKLIPDTGQRDPYRSLVSEIMLQQTQVSRVLEKFEPFIKRFPTVAALASRKQTVCVAHNCAASPPLRTVSSRRRTAFAPLCSCIASSKLCKRASFAVPNMECTWETVIGSLTKDSSCSSSD